MKPSVIKVGKTYVNKGKGKTRRKVIEIAWLHIPDNWYSGGPRPMEPGVLYRDNRGRVHRLYLSSFASWAGREATPEEALD